MKCRACWSDRVVVCRAPRWKAWAAAGLLAVPVKCQHCYYRFFVPFWSVARGTDEVRVSEAPTTLRKAA